VPFGRNSLFQTQVAASLRSEDSAHAAAQAAYRGIMQIYDSTGSACKLSSILMQPHLAMADPAQKVAASLSFENGAYAAQAVDGSGPPKQLLSSRCAEWDVACHPVADLHRVPL